ncbi:MAG: hypothetical protein MUF33_01450 [Candidatus Nanopelagicales bacterium]|nr:hypothetical protein [Candidatus Nanopelagicales bacterium]MCU0295643.1 hypothetical protein [Candidatus Nanopelagicales bacterium]MCU0297166.1 hypothetical protein [Candidatus Nanopelagicales bacterium]
MKAAFLVLPVAAILVVAGCSSSDSTDASPAPESPSASSPSASMIGPIMVKPGQTDVEATVGRSIVFDVGDDPGRWNIGSSNEQIVAVTQGGERDGAVFNPGAEALTVGEATVTLVDTEGEDALEYRITVTQ